MSLLLRLVQVVVGKTLAVPLGVLVVVGVGLALRHGAPGVWDAIGPVLLLVGVAGVLAVAALRG